MSAIIFNKKQRGFTLLELMIVIGIVVILAAMSITYSIDFYRSTMLDEESKLVNDVLQRARSYAISARESSSWGINFLPAENKYEFFKGSDCSTGTVYQTFQLPSNLDLEGISCVVFEINTGNPQIVN